MRRYNLDRNVSGVEMTRGWSVFWTEMTGAEVTEAEMWGIDMFRGDMVWGEVSVNQMILFLYWILNTFKQPHFETCEKT